MSVVDWLSSFVDAVSSLVGLPIRTIAIGLFAVALVWGVIAYVLEGDVDSATERAVGGLGGIMAGAVAVLAIAGEVLAGVGADMLLAAPNFFAEIGIIALAYGVIEGSLALSASQFLALSLSIVVVIGLLRYS